MCPVPGQPEVCGGIFLGGREPEFVLMAGENPPGWDQLMNTQAHNRQPASATRADPRS